MVKHLIYGLVDGLVFEQAVINPLINSCLGLSSIPAPGTKPLFIATHSNTPNCATNRINTTIYCHISSSRYTNSYKSLP